MLPGMQHGGILRSPHPHARIVHLDTSRAAALPGVTGLITGADVSPKYGILPVGHDETALAVDKVRYIGEGVAAVAFRGATAGGRYHSTADPATHAAMEPHTKPPTTSRSPWRVSWLF